MFRLSNKAYNRKGGFSYRALIVALAFLIGGTSATSANSAGNEKLSDVLELRGFIRIGGVLQFSVYNKKDQRSEWLRLNEKLFGYEVESYDSERNEIMIRHNDLRGVLPLQASQVHEYVEPPPATNPESKAPIKTPEQPPQVNSTAPIPETSRPSLPANRSSNLTPAPSRDGSFQPAIIGRPVLSRPPPASSPPAVETPKPGETDQKTYWDSVSSPPPLPPSAPPSYSPEE